MNTSKSTARRTVPAASTYKPQAHTLDRHFIPRAQLSVIAQALKGEERDWFIAKLDDLRQTFDTMHKVYGQDGLGKQAIAHLHYFSSAGDWYITERDTSAEQHQAFGYADLGYGGELGYISIAELVASGRVELDLHWTPKTLAECLK